ncbi:MAG: type I methionyl aminopeptidase [Chloroflexota bacterium]
MSIIIKSEREIGAMRQAGKIVATVLEKLREALKPGLKTSELDEMALSELARLGGRSSFKGYRGFPAHLCVSINDELVHGIPGERFVREGDLVSLDFGAIYRNFHGDAAITVGVGEISPGSRELMTATENALEAGIAAARCGARLGDVSAAIQDYAEARGFAVVREYTGHGIGRQMHEEPQIPNFGEPNTGPELKKGMTLALEPMLTAGDWRTKVASDGWTVSTADGTLCAHFEHTLAITNGQPEVLTRC